ncbi:hypothetical protein ASPZODRAFT_160090 [Penicilliopsis zonata CBS 506.65]|uniref:FAD-binding PCMH-type domain-containing protein n=1 Tax=Penicilliopsis zonata CBS 506.65 TaxID=1073090 RepID=A0A1L9SFH4_9EURO|nr:hypothetical protein ASPZODRAFT_160090 [Penicilliopsis zonata CBS 506.65]OJJ45902.1 hypothetical protein ASPZODRAFT_160090 [Penicilliopsis zonata CBS 506.65]
MPAVDIYKILKEKKVLGTQIPVYKSGEIEYELSVDVANLLYCFSRPKCVVKPEQTVHVVEVVKQAHKHYVPITVKNGGHSYAGLSTTNEGILLDLSRMVDVDLKLDAEGLEPPEDAEGPTVTMQGGALWAHVYRQLVINKCDGWVVNGGRCPTVGVSGFVLGGGLGPFTRRFGMGCDSLLEATLVTGNGKEVTVRAKDDPSSDEGKLFWALRGAGANNFGVVLSMKVALHKLQEESVVAGRFNWYPGVDTTERMAAFRQVMHDFYTTEWDHGLTIDSSWLCNMKERNGELGVRFLTYYDGNRDAFRKEVDRLLASSASEENVDNEADVAVAKAEMKKQLTENLKRRSIDEHSARFLHETLISQWSEETLKARPANKSYTVYASFVFTKHDEQGSNYAKITECITKHMDRFRAQFVGEVALLQVTFIHTGGKASEIGREPGPDATAFPWRDGRYIAYIMIQWDEKWLVREMQDFCRDFKQDLAEFSIGKKAGFLNFPDREVCVSEEDRHEAYYGPNSEEVRQIKNKWDEGKIFHRGCLAWAADLRPPGVLAIGNGGHVSSNFYLALVSDSFDCFV